MNKAIKNIYCFIIIATALLSLGGCRKTGYSAAEEKADNRFNDLSASVAETDEMIFYSAEANYLYYYDKTADQSGVLCGKPECSHDSEECNAECNGYILKGVGNACVSVSGGRIWFVMQEQASDSEFALYSENLDGSGREKVRAIPLPENTAPQSFYVYRGTLYTVGVANRVEAGTPQTQVRLIADDVNGERQIVALEKTFEARGSTRSFIRFFGDDVFFMISNRELCAIYKWDSKTEGSETILNVEEPLSTAGFWVTDDGEIYVSFSEDTAVLNRVENGGLVPVFELDTDGWSYLQTFLSDGILCCTGVDKESSERRLLVADFEGSILYKGIFPGSAAAAEYGAELSDTSFGRIGGNREELIIPILIDFYYENEEGEELGTTYSYLLQCKITEDGLEEKVLIKER
jgi:hypothetical protein